MFTPADLRFPLLLIKSKKISEQPGMVLMGNPPRWRKLNPGDAVPKDAHHALHKKGEIAAAAKLSKDPEFQKLSPEEQVAKIQAHAKAVQDANTASSKVATWKQKILAGKTPVTSEWKAFIGLPKDKRAKLLEQIKANPESAALFDAAAAKFRIAAHEDIQKHRDEPVAGSDAHPAAQAVIEGDQQEVTYPAGTKDVTSWSGNLYHNTSNKGAEAIKSGGFSVSSGVLDDGVYLLDMPENETSAASQEATVEASADNLRLLEADDAAALTAFSNQNGIKGKLNEGLAKLGFDGIWLKKPYTGGKAAWVVVFDPNKLSATDTPSLQEKLETLQDMLATSPDSKNAPAWKEKIDEIKAKLGPPAASAKQDEHKPEADTSGWSESAKAAKALSDEYKQVDLLNSKAVGAFKNKVRALAKKTPESDDKAVMLIDALVTKLWGTEYDPKVAGIEFAKPAPTESTDHAAKIQEYATGATYKQKAHKLLSQDPAWQKLEGKAKFDALHGKYLELQAAASLAGAMAKFKAALLAGKPPTKALVEKFNGLSKDEQAKVLKSVFAQKDKAEVGQLLAQTGVVPKGVKPKPDGNDSPKDGDTKEGDRNADGLVFHDGRWHREDGEQPQDLFPAADQAAREESQRLSMEGGWRDNDPNSPNYRFRDTGYIGGSRKEAAANMIRSAGRDGTRLRATDIDWEEIEKNPRQAKELITKSNVFGLVDWETLKTNGMEPAAGFLVDRVYARVAPEPGEDNPQARHDYAIGLESLRDRLESCKTPGQVTEVLKELHNEYEGVIFNAAESSAYETANAVYNDIRVKRQTLKAELGELQRELSVKSANVSELRREVDKRERRGWKRDADLDKQLAEANVQHDAAIKAIEDWKDAHPEAVERYETSRHIDENGFEVINGTAVGELLDQERHARNVLNTIIAQSKARNRIENPLNRAWGLMGKRFLGVMSWNKHKGSDKFAEHVAATRAGKISDWSWAEKTATAGPRVGKQKVRFQLQVAENFERIGGRPVAVRSTADLKKLFNLRDVQSGNWVLADQGSAAFHVQRSAEALADLADLLGVPTDAVSMNGRIAIAFGARGHGNAGFGGAARAHYEPVHRVVNITKMGGGGCLAHEFFHAIDNLANEAETGEPSKTEDFVTNDPELLPQGELKRAIIGLRSAMLEGNNRLTETVKYSGKDVRLAKHNIDRDNPSGIARIIKEAPNVETALLAIDGRYPADISSSRVGKRLKKQRDDWRRLAAAWHGGMNADGGEVAAPIGQPVSSFAHEATLLDEGQHGKYWSQTLEMSARAFQAWCEDRLAGQGRRNDYLSAKADNKYYRSSGVKPFPEGEERQIINAAFDRLAEALRKHGTLQKAMRLFHERAVAHSIRPLYIIKSFDEASHPRDQKGRFARTGEHRVSRNQDGQWFDANNLPLAESAAEELRAMGIPPGWKEVHLNPNTDEPLRVIGVDAKGRKQYVYSAAHAERAAAEKFMRLKDFSSAAPNVIKLARKHMVSDDGAAVLYLISRTGIRIGSDTDTKAKARAYGATTLLVEHVADIGHGTVMLNFPSKCGQVTTKRIQDRYLVAAIRSRMQGKASGDRLFSADEETVRKRLKAWSGNDAFKVKDFRTWHGTMAAYREIKNRPKPMNEKQKAREKRIIAKVVAERLGNTPSVALSSYIAPEVWDVWKD